MVINDIRFKGKRSIDWREVRAYLKNYVGDFYKVASTGDVIYIGDDLPSEYSGSKYTHSIKGTNAKAKANAVQGIPEMIEIAVGKHFRENKESKHWRNAMYGWYRYDSRFAIPVYRDDEEVERYLKKRQSPSTTKIAEAVGIARGTAYKYLVEMAEKNMIEYDGQEIRTNVTRKYSGEQTQTPIVGSIPCGSPQYEEENIEEYVSLPTAIFGKGDFFILRASGQSMIEAGIDDGDLVVVKKQVEAKEGDIVVALVDNQNTLKRYFRDDENKKIILHPENKKMKDIIVDECCIQGVACHIIKEL